MNREQYEKHDIKIRPIVLFVVLLLIIIAIIQFIAYFLDTKYARHEHFKQKDLEKAVHSLPSPKLQNNPNDDFVTYLEQEKAYLNSFGEVDGENRVRVPINMAIREYIEGGGSD